MLEGQSLTALAGAHLGQGDIVRATDHAERALAIHRETGHRLGEAHTLLILGQLDRRAGDLRAAQTHERCAVALLADIGAADAEEVGDLLGVARPDPAPG